jgi:hypothetical protein
MGKDGFVVGNDCLRSREVHVHLLTYIHDDASVSFQTPFGERGTGSFQGFGDGHLVVL